jgi:hypothetical protein
MSGKDVAYILVLKRGAKPSDDASYIQQVLRTSVPEAFTSSRVRVSASFGVGAVDEDGALMHAGAQFDDVLDPGKYDVITKRLSDASGDSGMVVVAYRRQKKWWQLWKR